MQTYDPAAPKALVGLAEAVGTVSAGVEVKRLGANTPLADQALAQRQPVLLNSVPVFNVREGYGAYIVPGVVVLILQQTLLMAIALMFGTWFNGTDCRSVPACPAISAC